MLLRDIAGSRGLPQTFLAKIFQKLARNGIVLSSRGSVRGYALARRPRQISVKDILFATEGSDFLDRCVLWHDRCGSTDPCVLHDHWKKVKEGVVAKVMEKTTLADLVRSDAVSAVTGSRRPHGIGTKIFHRLERCDD
jgi:Rrf2 family protein